MCHMAATFLKKVILRITLRSMYAQTFYQLSPVCTALNRLHSDSFSDKTSQPHMVKGLVLIVWVRQRNGGKIPNVLFVNNGTTQD